MEQTDALLLRSVDYGERDRIVTLLTPDHGRLAMLARGARGSRRRFGTGALEPFAELRVAFRWGRGELGQLQETKVKQAYTGILASLAKMTLAGAAFELLRDVLPSGHSEPDVYATSLELLRALDASTLIEESLLVCFQVRVMSLVGLAPRLDACGRSGQRPAAGRAAYFDPREGCIVASAAGGGPLLLGGGTRMALLSALGPSWREASQGWSERQLAEARAAVHAFVEHRLDRRLRTATLENASTARGPVVNRR